MKSKLIPLALNELLWRSALFRRAERLLIFISRVVADLECHVRSSWVDSTRIYLQLASGLSMQLCHQTTEERREAS